MQRVQIRCTPLVPISFSLSYLKNAFPYWVLFICVFLDAYSYIERAAKFAALDRPWLPLLNGKICRSGPASFLWLNGEVKAVEVGLAEAALFDFQ